jgi:hypothetical protein
MMTRKDYVKVSAILATYQDVIDSDDYYELVMDFGKMMKLDNDRFDLSRFLIASGIDTNALVSHAMATLPKSASDHVALVSDVEEGWGRAY